MAIVFSTHALKDVVDSLKMVSRLVGWFVRLFVEITFAVAVDNVSLRFLSGS